MRRIMRPVIFAALLMGLASAGNPRSALAASYDGNWSVLIITEKGD